LGEGRYGGWVAEELGVFAPLYRLFLIFMVFMIPMITIGIFLFF
jgi:hypothetical protein